MRLPLLAALILAPAASVAAPDRPAADMPVLNPNAYSPVSCPPTSRYDAMRRGGRLGAQKLNELPAADLYRTVYRRIGGCEAPIVAGYGFGATQR